jgi:hypothetical protein
MEKRANRDAGPGASITRGELTGRRVIFSVDEEMDTIGELGSNFNTNNLREEYALCNKFRMTRKITKEQYR